MLFKGILCVLILLAGFGAGKLKAKSFENRVFHLQELVTVLKILESEMKYRLDPLPDLLLRLGSIKDGMAGEFLETAGRYLKVSTGKDSSLCWEEAVETVYQESVLSREDKQILLDLGVELGKTDIVNQEGLFRRTFSMLEVQIEKAAEEKKTKGKMYQSLGTAVGILIVILLI